MGARFASNKRAIAYCDVCGFQYKLKDLKGLVVKGVNTNIKACTECWNPDHPQLKLGEFPVDDPQALRDPGLRHVQHGGVHALCLDPDLVLDDELWDLLFDLRRIDRQERRDIPDPA